MARTSLVPKRAVNLASAPTGPSAGTTYFDTTTAKWRYWNGSSWVDSA